ncbi:RND family efflux transporter MFP subunit [Filimonas zeae]|uniref:Cation efflux system protein n=1 Tax=Filimonas zeae TaxID=1737353 RepID=A0A917J312_9BACT|nr:efflux RND transporter periplasmic adaptor subunit [Filimonas zeae]MDR6342330.1 RND family efflux transporter MFP subunit [Filimonas zeae]GGH80900.1 cation efflux system protein [Filimonas zeae]
MQKIFPVFIAMIAVTLTASSCKEKDPLKAKKEELAKLKTKQSDLNKNITKLEGEIARLDPNAVPEKPKLVSIDTVTNKPFSHFIELQGRVDAENIAYVTPRGGGGQVKAVYVKKGERVSKGQLLLKLDDAVARKQIAQLQTQLDYAQNLYERRNNLWKENIGTEVELITAKNNVEQVQRQMELAKEQLGFSNVYADMNGVAEEVTIRVGELFTGGNPASGIKLVNTGDLKVTAQVPENYLGRVKQGDNLLVVFPDVNKTINARITLAGQLIDVNSRSFYIEARLPNDKAFKPNQVALVKIQDYSVAQAVTAPVNTLQTDDKGKFLLVAVNEAGKWRAKKRQVQQGELYGDRIEIKEGLKAGDLIITDGYQSLYDGQLITTK